MQLFYSYYKNVITIRLSRNIFCTVDNLYLLFIKNSKGFSYECGGGESSETKTISGIGEQLPHFNDYVLHFENWIIITCNELL